MPLRKDFRTRRGKPDRGAWNRNQFLRTACSGFNQRDFKRD